MTEYEKDCVALDRVIDAAKTGRLQYKHDFAWRSHVGDVIAYLSNVPEVHRIKPEPKRLPLTGDDWEGCYQISLTCEKQLCGWRQVVGVVDDGSVVILGNAGRVITVLPSALMESYSRRKIGHDFIGNWEPCWKEGEVRDERR